MKKQVIRPWPVTDDHKIPFVPAIKVSGGALLFISGMGALPPVHRHPHVPEEWILPDDPAAQARRALDKIKTIVEQAGGKFEHIVKITRYLKDIAEQDKVNEVIYEYFGDHLPCSTTVQVGAFVVPTMKIEIDAWAVIPEGKSRATSKERSSVVAKKSRRKNH
jgi:enamine deaminase RidA (YjgF/YER057c/UK114 family)